MIIYFQAPYTGQPGFGQLIADHFKYGPPDTLTALANVLGISRKTTSRWLHERQIPRIPKRKTLLGIARHTDIPMEVLLLLVYGSSVWYHVRLRHFRRHSDEEIFQLDEAISRAADSDHPHIWKLLAPDSTELAQAFVDYELRTAGSQSARADVIIQAARQLPELNYLIQDSWHMHAGHLACFPLTVRAYHELKAGQLTWDILSPDKHFSLNTNAQMTVLYIYGLFASCRLMANKLLKHLGSWLCYHSSEWSSEVQVASHVVTKERRILSKRLMMAPTESQFTFPPDTEVSPTLYECRLADLRATFEKWNQS